MLSAAHRLRRSQDFQYVIRRGVRVGRPSLVVHAASRASVAGLVVPTPRVGFVVSKAVGNAVVRNRVKRRLREFVRVELSASGETNVPADTDLVVRALPPAATSPQLAADFRSAWQGSLRRLVGASR